MGSFTCGSCRTGLNGQIKIHHRCCGVSGRDVLKSLTGLSILGRNGFGTVDIRVSQDFFAIHDEPPYAGSFVHLL